jgi:hypothetical protein
MASFRIRVDERDHKATRSAKSAGGYENGGFVLHFVTSVNDRAPTLPKSRDVVDALIHLRSASTAPAADATLPRRPIKVGGKIPRAECFKKNPDSKTSAFECFRML